METTRIQYVEAPLQPRPTKNGGAIRRASLFLEKKASVPIHKRKSFYVFLFFFIVGTVAIVAFAGRLIVESSKEAPVPPSRESYKEQFPEWFYDGCEDKVYGCPPLPTKKPTTAPTPAPTGSPVTLEPTSAPTSSPVAPPPTIPRR